MPQSSSRAPSTKPGGAPGASGPTAPDSAAQVRAAGDLLGEGLSGVVGIAADAHRAVVDRVESFLPASARPVTAATRGIAGGVFGLVGAAHRWAPVAVAEVAARTTPDIDVAESTPGRRVLPLVNGLWGDRVAQRHPALAIPMAVRAGGADVPLTSADLARAFPSATGHVVVFVHGLMESDEAWWGAGDAGDSFGARLEADLGASAVHVRYNSGARVSSSGRALAELLEELVGQWPVPVRRVDLVGHSMGGLVARSAGHAAREAGHDWVTRQATLVTLGTPHLGAPLAKGTHVADWALAQVAETEPYGRVLASRSAGIRDLRHGAIVEADWVDRDPAALFEDPPADLPLLPHVTYCHVAATITADPEHPAGRLVGDGLVRHGSASGRGRTRHIPFGEENGARLGGVDHLALMRHPEVYDVIRDWIDRNPAGSGNLAD
jgi:pimeloyl-ACP methyl ester carboxylesterase